MNKIADTVRLFIAGLVLGERLRKVVRQKAFVGKRCKTCNSPLEVSE